MRGHPSRRVRSPTGASVDRPLTGPPGRRRVVGMGSIVVQEFITLDGVVQGGGGPDEDRDGGFEQGGWAMDYDEQHDRADEGGPLITEWERRVDALLLGRRTYEIWAGAWGVWDE